MQTIKQNGNITVVITGGDGRSYVARLYVSVRKGLGYAAITPQRWEGKTLKGAEKWADKQLSAS